jgi:hypothetical protein
MRRQQQLLLRRCNFAMTSDRACCSHQGEVSRKSRNSAVVACLAGCSRRPRCASHSLIELTHSMLELTAQHARTLCSSISPESYSNAIVIQIVSCLPLARGKKVLNSQRCCTARCAKPPTFTPVQGTATRQTRSDFFNKTVDIRDNGTYSERQTGEG